VSREVVTRTLIIGSGISGLAAAISLAENGVDCLMISTAPTMTETNTVYAQGGVIYDTSGNPKELFEDILKAGAGINYRPAVQQLVDLGPALVKKILLERAGAEFDREESGAYHFTREGGHARSRILHRGDESGKSIEEALMHYAAAQPKIRMLPRTSAVNLLMTSFHQKDRAKLHEEAQCFGAFVFDQEAREMYPVFAPHTILATGGVGQLYLHNTNSKFSRGDGIALGYRAGCRLENLEYLQFHPTTFFHPGSRRFLISEALRGEGAVLITPSGQRFLSGYLPEFPIPELAPRDRVAKAIHQELIASGAACVYLDITHKPADWIRDRFPFVYRNCLQNGIDITLEPIPVIPAAHYHCGGIWTDLAGHTSISRLWAVGEVACTGVHGANRLASTSLLEGLVWGTRAGEAITQKLKAAPKFTPPAIDEWRHEKTEVDPSFLSQDWLTLKHTMWNYVGLVKSETRLARAEGIFTELSRGIDTFYQKAVLSDALIGLRHAALAARLVLNACKKNPRSLGCYAREDLEI
jgi:L-aspartate oxidase